MFWNASRWFLYLLSSFYMLVFFLFFNAFLLYGFFSYSWISICGLVCKSYRLKRVVFAKKIMFFSFFNLFSNAFVLCYYVYYIWYYISSCFYIYRVYIFISLNRSSWQKYDNLMYSVNPFFLWRFDVGHENKTYHSEKMWVFSDFRLVFLGRSFMVCILIVKYIYFLGLSV